MRLKTQFAMLTVSIALVPVIFGIIFFGAQGSPRDPREPTRQFLSSLADIWHSGRDPGVDEIKRIAEEAGLPLREVALLSADGRVLGSTFMHMAAGSQARLGDLTSPLSADSRRPRPEIKLMTIAPGEAGSPLVLADILPFYTRQDIRNRNIVFIGVFTFGLFFVAGVLSLAIMRSISRAIRTLEKDTAIVATGNLDHEVAGSGNHEILMLAKSINLMRLNLKDMLTRRSKMLMGVSHDLKTPISLIQGYADALADNVATDGETRAKYLRIIQGKAKQLEDLTSELIDFLKIGGDGTIQVEEVDLEKFLRQQGERFESDSRLLKRELYWGFGANAGKSPDFALRPVTMNRLLVERALENLVGNALKYSASRGKIGLRLIRKGGLYAFSVTDDGPGIPEGDEPYVFDAFYRGSHSRADGGHGFGLTIVKAVADLHGWTVSVGKREDGKPGAEAILTLGRIVPS